MLWMKKITTFSNINTDYNLFIHWAYDSSIGKCKVLFNFREALADVYHRNIT